MADNRASTVTIGPRLTRLLRRLPDDVTAGVKTAIAEAATEIEQRLLGRVPVAEGDLAQSIGIRTRKDGLGAIVGPGLRGGGKSWRAYQSSKARWREYGTRGYIPKPPSKGRTRATGAAVPPQPPAPWIAPTLDDAREDVNRRLVQAVRAALQRCTGTGG